MKSRFASWVGLLALSLACCARDPMEGVSPAKAGHPSSGEGGSYSGAGGFRPMTAEDPWGGAPNVAPAYLACLGGLLRGGGRRAVDCEGECIHVLQIETSQPSDGAICREIDVRLIALNGRGPVRTVVGKLPLAAWSRIFGVQDELREAKVRWSSDGCPTCNPAVDRAWVTRDFYAAPPDTEFHYELEKPPPAIMHAHALVQALIDEMSTCSLPGGKKVMLKECQEQTDRCWFGFEDGKDGTTSVCPIWSPEPTACDTSARCFCQEGVLPRSNTCLDDTQATGGPLTFGDFCNGQPLPDALRMYAAKIGQTAYLGPACSMHIAR